MSKRAKPADDKPKAAVTVEAPPPLDERKLTWDEIAAFGKQLTSRRWSPWRGTAVGTSAPMRRSGSRPRAIPRSSSR